MSLIHEALKRAEVDKLRRSPYFNNLTVIPPAEDEVPPPARPVEPPPPARLAVPTLKILTMLVIAGVGVGGWCLWKEYRGRLGVPAMVAAQDTAGPAALATAKQTPPAANTPAMPTGAATIPTAQALRATPTASAPTPAEASIEDVAPPPAAPAGAIAPDPTPTEAQPQAGVTAQPPVEPPEVATPKKVSDASRTGQTTKARSATIKPPAASAGPAAAPREAAPKLAAAKPDAGRYRLSAIGRGGPEGNVALINEKVVQEGQTILEAKVVKIGPTYVELEAGGTRFTIRL
jgi:hypothetical protein